MVRPKETDDGKSGGQGKKKAGTTSGVKKESKKISVSQISLDEPKPKAAPRQLKGKGKSPANDYMAGVDLPPSDDEEPEVINMRGDDNDDDDSDEGEGKPSTRGAEGRGRSSGVVHGISFQVTDRELRKREKKEQLLAQAHDQAKTDAMKEDDDNAFSVVLGAKSAVLDSEEGLDDKARDVKIENFSVSARGKELFRNASITIVHGRRYGLVGPNGKGKSTLMKLLAKRQLPVPKNIDVLLVEQEVVGDDRSALQAVVSADQELMELRAEETRLRALAEKEGEEAESTGQAVEGDVEMGKEEVDVDEDGEEVGGALEGDDDFAERRGSGRASKKLSGKDKHQSKARGKGVKGKTKGAAVREKDEFTQASLVEEDSMTAGEKLAAVYERMQIIGAEAAEARASKILAGLGFTKDMQARSTKSFSGGWRMRISLARALYIQPTLLLLDEPTNHLDLRAVIWLEEYLMRWKKTLVVVSHDRDFLNSVSTDIIHLHDEKLLFYKGNFEAFEEMYEQKRRENNKKFETFEKQLRAAKRSGNKANQDKVKDKAKMVSQKEAKAKGKGKGAADEEDAPTEAPKRWRDYAVEFHFPEPTELTPPLLQLKEVEFQYPAREDFALKNIDVGVDMGTRVAIVGPNGAGKSTMLNLLAGDLLPTMGEARQSQKLRVGRYSQHFVDLLQFDETPVQYLLRLYPDQDGPSKQEAVRAKLGKFGLPSHNHLTPIVKLSGGQKARVVFTSISMKKPHILLLDEPTNHLDMQSIDALADALEEFTGGVVLVSHDSRLISQVCGDEERSEIWVVDEGTCIKYPGSFNEYKEELIKEIIAEVEE